MSKEKKLIPELRFPGFAKKEGWVVTTLSKVYSFKITNSFSRDSLNYKIGTVKNIHYGDIHTKFSTLFDITKEIVPYINPDIPLDRINRGNYCIEGDMIFADASEDMDDVGKSIEIVNLNNERLLAGLHTFLARQIEPNLIVGFGGYLFKSDSIRTQIKRESQGAKVLGISKGRIADINIYFPENKQEQQKIASCLSSLDELLAAHTEKLDTLKDHKKGLMQNLFPKEGETVPKVRFSEFEGDGEWVEERLESLTNKIGDGIHTTPKYDESGDYYFINGNNLIEGKIIVDEKTKRVSSDEFEKHKKDLTAKTIFLSINGTIGNVAFYNHEKVVLGKSACYITPSQELNNVFLYYSLQSPKISNYFISELTGSTIKNLSLRTIRDTAFSLPPEIEQQKIASCLSAVDELITAQADKIEQLQHHKKGLMQGLFPKIES